MDNIQKVLIKLGRVDLAQKYFERVSSLSIKDFANKVREYYEVMFSKTLDKDQRYEKMDSIQDDLSKYKKIILKEFEIFAKKYFENEKKKYNKQPSYFLGSLFMLMSEAFTKDVFRGIKGYPWSGTSMDDCFTLYNKVIGRGKKIGMASITTVLRKSFDSVFGKGSFAELQEGNKKIRTK